MAAITKENLILFREEKIQEKQKIDNDRNLSIEETHIKVEEFSNNVFQKLDIEYSQKFAAIDAQINVLDDLIIQVDKSEEIV